MKEEKVEGNKQSLKRQRIKTYFLDAAKEMIAEEGVDSVSVRKVAEVAGYSYATLYNYFEDLNELLWDVKQVMINDLVHYIQKKMTNVLLDIEGIKKLFGIYTEYYFDHPNIFKFFYFYKLVKPDNTTENTGEEPDFGAMMKETFKSFVQEGKLCEMDVEIVAKTCIYAVHGMLTLFFSGNGDMTKDSVHMELGKMIDYLL